MTSYPKDSAGVDFDPAIHQTRKDGSPWLNKRGRYFVNALKSKRSKTSKKSKTSTEGPQKSADLQDPPQTSAEVQDVPQTPETDRVPALHEIAPATPEEILGTDLPPVTVDPVGDPLPEDPPQTSTEGTPPEATAPPTPPVFAEGSAVAPDAPPPDSELKREGMARAIVSVFETSTRMTIDADEWELDPLERDDLTGSIRAVLDKYGVNPDLGPEGDLAVKLFAIGARRAPKPKTKAKLLVFWSHIKRKWFGAKPPEEKPEKKKPEPEPVE